LITHLTIVGEHVEGEMDVGLRRRHLARVAEAQDGAQTLLTDRGAYRADRRPDHAGGNAPVAGASIGRGGSSELEDQDPSGN